MIADFLKYLLGLAVLIGGGAIVYLVGEALIGSERRGGKRLVLSVVGLGLCALGAGLCHHSLRVGGDVQPVLLFALGALFFLGGSSLTLCGVFGRNKTIEKWFWGLMDGL